MISFIFCCEVGVTLAQALQRGCGVFTFGDAQIPPGAMSIPPWLGLVLSRRFLDDSFVASWKFLHPCVLKTAIARKRIITRDDGKEFLKGDPLL